MAEPTVEPTTPEPVAVTPAPEPEEPKSLNAQAKDLPWVKELMAKAARADEMTAAQEQAKREAEEKALRDAGKFDELAAKHAAELEAIKGHHDKTLLEMSLKTELIKTGFQNDIFVNGAIKSYDAGTHGEISAYVAALAADEANKALLAGVEGRTVYTPPGKSPSPSGSGGELRGEALRAAASSEDPQIRLKAIEIKKAYFDKHGTFEGLYK